ncbi:MAG: phosphoribosylformimino-5-aminoimidazole carboxamide ribotide isomerase [Methanothermococcus sp.]|jgi:phosphoribosylformimino-5-aminoimidazole carboxamide ribotide isomerase|uniref:HisA/HisF family protein n=1 Tax=Methanothermococcus TaxID=155862 RepID=UPI00036A22D0|nr:MULTISPECIES: HisA/HisF family protein [Methanothermococcus]MDK2790283.1 phosphoribosylformimino-5-aminoimidazole carboxamide ribotide isomerase [Methanothermococcus sp.]
MEIIPVLDLMDKIAVHGKSGNRQEYKPLKSILCNSSNPVEIVEKYKENGVKTVYIADLDAIMGKGDNFETIKKIDINKIVDAGVKNRDDLQKVLKICDKAIIGTETLKDLSLLTEKDIILSLDFKDGKLLNYDLDHILNEVNNTNDKIPLIILDISSVGTQRGINQELIKKIMDKTNNPVYIGGGIKNENDLKTAGDLGVKGVLIGTSIHNGTLNLKEIIQKYGE